MKKILLFAALISLLAACAKPDAPKMDNPLIKVPKGAFWLGQSKASSIFVRTVLTHDYSLSKYEITNQEYCEMLNFALKQDKVEVDDFAILNKEGTKQRLLLLSHIQYKGGEFVVASGKDYLPAVSVSWYGSAFYCNMRSMMENLTPLYNLTDWKCNLYGAKGYRLPTEAEWEYAARYNDQRTYPWGEFKPSDKIANFNFNAGHFVVKVGSYPEGVSKLGFYDMAGNAYEWCNDFYADYEAADSLINPAGPDKGTAYVVRGGSWNYNDATLMSAFRSMSDNANLQDFYGFRVCEIE